MTSNIMNHTEVDERAFAIFLMDGLYYFLQQDSPLRHGHIIDYCNRLGVRWQQMTEAEKELYWDRAVEELRRIRRYSHVDIYREAMRDSDQPPPPPDHEDNRRQSRRRFMS